MCNCEFCIKCDCGHSADSHIAGDGHCYMCKCPSFHSPIVDAYEKAILLPENKGMQLDEFANHYIANDGW